MNTKEKYNQTILTIEEYAKDADMSAQDLAIKVAKDNALNLRDMNAIISYLTGSTLLNYIKDRKMMAAYQYLIEKSWCDIDKALEIAGFDNQSSFTKRFTNYFGLPPKKAHDKKDKTKFVGPMTWEMISHDLDVINREKGEVEKVKETTIFSISQTQYAKIMEAADYQVLYDLDTVFCNYAYDLSEDLHISLKNAFQFVDDVLVHQRDLDEDFGGAPRNEKEMLEVLNDFSQSALVQRFYFRHGFSISEIIELRCRIPMSEEDFFKLDPDMVRTFAYTIGMGFDYFKQAWEYYHENAPSDYGSENLNEYFQQINCGGPKEIAFDELLPWSDDFDYKNCNSDASMPWTEEDDDRYEAMER